MIKKCFYRFPANYAESFATGIVTLEGPVIPKGAKIIDKEFLFSGEDFGYSVTYEIGQSKIETIILQALGEASALFMNQECRGTEITMPEDELIKIAQEAYNKIRSFIKEKIEGEL